MRNYWSKRFRLEESELTNAGYGGSLTESGQFETEAGIAFYENDLFGHGALACVTNTKNPIRGAVELARDQAPGPDQNGRIPPTLLAGPGADRFIAQRNLKSPENLISSKSLKTHSKYSHIVNKRAAEESSEHNSKRQRLDDKKFDTVGAIGLTETAVGLGQTWYC